MPKTVTVVMRPTKETKNTIVYSEETDGLTPAKLPTLYLPKTTIALLGNPAAIEVSITAAG